MNAGDTITYRDTTGELRTVIVHKVYDDVKNGRPGFDGYLPGQFDNDAAWFWGYTSQVR